MSIEQAKALAAKVAGTRLARAQSVGGCVWVREHSGKRYVLAPSSSGSGHYYRVDAKGCTCAGYANRGYCKHADHVYLKLAERAGQPAPTLAELAAQAFEDLYGAREVA